jgi:starch synthase
VHVALLTREWPPDVYGGAGVHVFQLAEHLRRLVDLEVHCFGEPRPDATGHGTWAALDGGSSTLAVMATDLSMAGAVHSLDVVHSHTWYAGLAGHLISLLHDAPHVVTAHSLEPLRPWKAEQLGGGYAVSCWIERTAMTNAAAVIAVSEGMRADITRVYPELDPARVHVVYNGVDTHTYRVIDDPIRVTELGVDPSRPIVLFVGRITHQKGVAHLLAAAHSFVDDAQLVLCAGAADTPELATQVANEVAALRSERSGVVWIQDMLPTDDVVRLMSAATVFVCPSIYEPLGIVNLEAMACGTAVVASNVGGIPEVVVDGETGILVPYDANKSQEFETGLAAAVNAVIDDPTRAAAMGAAGRQRAVDHFAWSAIAAETVDVYRRTVA